jgi:hypothetical protein
LTFNGPHGVISQTIVFFRHLAVFWIFQKIPGRKYIEVHFFIRLFFVRRPTLLS